MIISTNHYFAWICSIQIFKSLECIVVAHSPSFSFPAVRGIWRACCRAITLLKQQKGLVLLTLTVIPSYVNCDHAVAFDSESLHVLCRFLSLYGVCIFSTILCFNFFGFGSFVSLVIIEKSKSECNRKYWATIEKCLTEI